MRIIAAVILPAILASVPAHAEKRTFTIANNPDGYGIDRCLAAGAPCGVAVATAYCRARDFEQALSFHRLDRDSGAAFAVAVRDCAPGRCDAVVAIECAR